MKVLTVNAGSSSIKSKIISTDTLLTDIELNFKYYQDNNNIRLESFIEGKVNKIELNLNKNDLVDCFVDYIQQFISNKKVLNIDAVIYRIVHLGNVEYKKILINDFVLDTFKKNCVHFSPLHNSIAFDLMEKLRKVIKKVAHIGVLDSAFFMKMPEINYMYAIPREFYKKYGVRRFGFHGFSHEYISQEIQKIYKNKHTKEIRIVSCHLGSGNSVAAIKGGNPIDTSFGFTPEENIISSTRCGEIDYSAVAYIKKRLNFSDEQITDLLYNKSGFLAISGYTKDMKILLQDYDKKPEAKQAVDMYVYNVSKYIAQMIVSLNGIDILVFTGGIGEGSDLIRKWIVNNLNFMGIYLDDSLNDMQIDVKQNLKISSKKSKIDIWVIPTNEEIMMVKNVFF